MFDVETVTTQISQSSKPSVSTRRISLLKRNSTRRLTRAHLNLARRPAVAAAGNEALTQIAAQLSQALGAEVGFEARVVDAAINPFGGLSRFSAFALIELGALGQLAILELDLVTLNTLLAKVAGSPARMSAPNRLTQVEEAAFGWLCLSALACLRKVELIQKHFGPRLLAVYIERGEILERVDCRVRHVAIELNVKVGQTLGAARLLLLPAPACDTAIAPIEEQLPTDISPEVSAAKITTRCYFGRCVLEARDMAGLQVGDVVMVAGAPAATGLLSGPARLVTALFELHGQFSADGFTLTRAETRATSLPQEPTMKVRDEANLPSLPVEVEIELTRLRISVSELATLRPGAVLSLRIGVTEPVTLRVGDRAIARAELVDIEGEIGARIIGLLK
jgi:type III secretion protein Q